jgi:dimethylaniline monooxygenase (N-oxide forming)
MEKISVAIVGAGISGLAAIKEFIEVGGYDVICFEKDWDVGGIWRYSEDSKRRTVTWSTLTNSSKYLVF